MLRVIVLGAAAGGGLPQWNCGCVNCRQARESRARFRSTQASLAVSSDGTSWFLINASPDLRQQIEATPQLHPRHDELRHSPIAGVILTNAEVDAVTGLLSMREGSPFSLYAHRQVLDVLNANTIFNVLHEGVVNRVAIDPETTFSPLSGEFDVTPFSVSGKEALYLEGAKPAETGDTLGLTLRDHSSGKTLHVVTACADVTDALASRLDGADAIFFDGTLWDDDEMIAAGLSQKTGRRMGHVAMSGKDGAIARLATVKARRKIFVHINNSNPVWRPDSAERAFAEKAGWEIGYDGMEIVL